MQQCAWCETAVTRRWEKSNDECKVTICQCCYRSKRNGYVACSMCRTRRLCKSVNSMPMCGICSKIDFVHKEAVPISCLKCDTTRSMSWHTLASGESVCLYCYHDGVETQLAPNKKKFKAMHRSNYLVRDDVEMAALMLCHLSTVC